MFAVICRAAGANVALTSTSYHHQKQLANIKERITSQWQKRTMTTPWPDNLEWMVTDTPKMMMMMPTETAGAAAALVQKNKTAASSSPPAATAADPSPSSDNIAFLQFTSGSTSDPKGVMITLENLAHNLSMITADLAADDSTVVVSWLPMYHDMGLIGSFLGVLYCGGSGYYLSPLHFLQRPSLWLEAVSLYRATHLQSPNFAFKLTARKFDSTTTAAAAGDTAAATTTNKLDLSSVRHIINAAEPVDTDGMTQFYDTFCPYGLKRGIIYPTFGLAEHTVFVCSGGTQILHVDKLALEVNGLVREVDAATKANYKNDTNGVVSIVGCGYPARQGVDVRIVDTTDDKNRPVDDDIVGEIWIHSPSKAAGYYGKPEESRHDFCAELNGSSAAGTTTLYLRTGDLGFMHQSELFICGRLKDLIIVGGRNYYPQDIEATAEACAADLVRPGCSAAFTIDPVSSAEVVALVMELREAPTTPDATKSVCTGLAQTIRAAINQEHSLSIASIMFLQKGTVPKTRSGKIARAWCRKGYNDGTLKVIHHESFMNNKSTEGAAFFESPHPPLEIEGPAKNGPMFAEAAAGGDRLTPEEVRNLPKEEIIQRLLVDLSRVAAVPPSTIDKTVPMISMMDSLTISQFKGLVEHRYHVRPLSDEYLFRESSTLTKLSEVVKLGYAPDDGDNAAAGAAAAMTTMRRGSCAP
jgi:acyl-CoA synthetase (AMP-forming)/AMP-acid ligase II